MDVRLLRYFLAIAEEGNITKAAERLHMSQPPLSKQMKQLEEELGVSLFIRGKTHIQLTEAGLFLQKRAEELVAAFELTERQIVEYQDGKKGHIQLGGVESFAANRLPGLIAEYHDLYPDTTFWVASTANTSELIDKLDKGVIDLAFIREPFDEEKYNSFEVMNDAWGVLIPWDHPLADPKIPRITAQMLEHEVLTSTTAQKELLQSWFRQNDVEPHFFCMWDSSIVGAAMAELGVSLSITLNSRRSKSAGRQTVYKKLTPELRSSIYTVWSRNRVLAESTLRFLDFLRGTAPAIV